MNVENREPEVVSYYGRPIIKAPIWEPVIAWYFFFGGLAGASAGLGLGARLADNQRLARNATYAGVAGVGVSPILLIADLGRPERFYNMLRVVKVTSPMSVGTWILTGCGTALGITSGCEALGIFPRVKIAAQTLAGILGLPLTTYTAALVADTAVPVWHDARRELPFVFAGSAAASAGATAAITTPTKQAGPARRMAVAGALLELAATKAMEYRLGPLISEPYHEGAAGRLAKLANACTAAGAALMALTGRRRTGSVVAGGLLLAGSLFERKAVFRAGSQSAADPKYVVVPQRERVAREGTQGTVRPSETVDRAASFRSPSR